MSLWIREGLRRTLTSPPAVFFIIYIITRHSFSVEHLLCCTGGVYSRLIKAVTVYFCFSFICCVSGQVEARNSLLTVMNLSDAAGLSWGRCWPGEDAGTDSELFLWFLRNTGRYIVDIFLQQGTLVPFKSLHSALRLYASYLMHLELYIVHFHMNF